MIYRGRSQAVKATGFDPVIGGSNPPAPANSNYWEYIDEQG